MGFHRPPRQAGDDDLRTAHAHALYLHGETPVHRLPPHVKLTALLGFVGPVVATPREAFWAHFLAATLLAGVVILAELPWTTVLRRLTVELPFLAFALLLPLVGQGERIEIWGVSLSVEGLWGAWTILAKATLGVGASIVLAATTSVSDLLRGLDRLRTPRAMTAIAGFMVRYLDIVAAEFTRRSVAMASRGYRPRWLWQSGPMAKSLGSLFIRSFERGERLHQAMISRGYMGRMPAYGGRAATRSEWAAGMSVPAAALALALLAATVFR